MRPEHSTERVIDKFTSPRQLFLASSPTQRNSGAAESAGLFPHRHVRPPRLDSGSEIVRFPWPLRPMRPLRDLPGKTVSASSSTSSRKSLRGSGPPRAIAVTRVLDEADIIEAFVRHTSVYTAHHILMDNGSTDGTIEILKQLRDEGYPLTIYRNKSVSYVEQSNNGMLFEQAVRRGADWVLFLDSDEFIDDRHVDGGLAGCLERLDREPNGPSCLQIPVFNYVVAETDLSSEMIAPIRMQSRLPTSHSVHVMVHADAHPKGVIVTSGAHAAIVNGVALPVHQEPGLVIAHYSERDPFQHLAKAVKGWAKVVAAGETFVGLGTSFHYKPVFDILRDHPGDLLRNDGFIRYVRHAHIPDIQIDPIIYKGSALRYTGEVDHAMRAVRSLVGYIGELASRHGAIVEQISEAREWVIRADADLKPLE